MCRGTVVCHELGLSYEQWSDSVTVDLPESSAVKDVRLEDKDKDKNL